MEIFGTYIFETNPLNWTWPIYLINVIGGILVYVYYEKKSKKRKEKWNKKD